ncbi:putative Mg-dependent DNase [Magnetofaba australis IT-1]|uniref:Putative Mg-dependent DNase n=1 Tax=Magnetofaba australis IT-1 TaxID=1434232 RepID=A0A1Y2K1V8_9PROT|nr:putative Mg-dependent DNase [Magnetofaba australis IT-1]
MRQWLLPGTRLQDIPSQRALLTEPGMHLTLGLHPMMCDDHPADAIEQLAQAIERDKPCAIGEIGLDLLAAPESFPRQQALFAAQLALARRYDLPVMLHVRKAHGQTLEMLRADPPPRGGVVHAFGGSLETAREYRALGFCFGLGGMVTRPQARKIRAMAAALPLAWIVLETDAPDLPPHGRNGERNEPAYLPQIAAAIAQLRGCDAAALIDAADANARTLFDLPGEPA